MQEGVALRAGLHRTEIGMLEHGKRKARINTIVKLCGALEAQPADLLEGIEWLPGQGHDGRFSIPPPRQPLFIAKQSKKPGDLNRLAAAIVGDATDETPSEPETPESRAGRAGGRKGGKVRVGLETMPSFASCKTFRLSLAETSMF